MLQEIKNEFTIINIILKNNILKEMVSKGSFFAQIAVMMLNNASFVVQWIIIFQIKNDFLEINLYRVLIIWTMACIIYGISHLIFENVYSLPELIVNGKLDVYLTQPRNVLLNLAISSSSISALGDILYGVVLSIIIAKDIMQFLSLILFSTLGSVFFTSFFVILGSLSFWLKRSVGLVENCKHFSSTLSTYPSEIFNKLTKILIYVITPVGMTIYLPTEIFLNFSLLKFVFVVLSNVLICGLSIIVFNLGLKKYSSSNLMVIRI